MGKVFKRNDSPYWWLAYKVGGKRVRESSGAKTKSLAMEILKHKESEALISPYTFPHKNKNIETAKNEFLEWVQSNRRAQTLRSYTSILKTFQEFCKVQGVEKISQVNLKFLDDYKLARVKLTKTWTVNNHIIVLKAFFNKLEEWSYLETNPVKQLKRVEVTDSKLIRFLSEEEYRQFMEVCKKEYPEFYPMFYVLVHTGLRKGELLNLEWKDIDLKQGFIYIRSNDTFMPKGIDRKTGKAKERIVPMHEGLERVLKELPKEHEKVFKSYDKHRLRRVLIKIAHRAGIKDLTRLHELRHSYASFLVKKGVDIYKVKELLGHSEIKDTLKYAHLPAVYMKDDVKLLEGLDHDNK
ncbi:MAG: tyrosine-type recombinase/integrase [Candidatus Omnitrophica bacterium]|nr:tyrosine-type recombinase/integrase [Candidatus Omnitrophota bacterium]